jgi:predicted MPP superfamily phosphohydrolase
LIHSGDFLLISTFVLVQSRITVLLLRSAKRRFRGLSLALARAAIVLFDTVLLFGYALSFSEVFARLHVPSTVSSALIAGAIFYLLLATAGLAVHTVTSFALRRWSSDADPRRREVIKLAGKAAMLAPAAVLGYGTFVQRLDFHVREVDVPIPELPPDLEGFRILQLSDIHRGPFLGDDDLGRVIDASLGLKPHLAVITGDLISRHGDPLDSCIQQLARVKADAGVFGCMGNHERYAGVSDYTEAAAARVGIRFLRGRAQALRIGSATLNLAGVDYQRVDERTDYLRGAERLIQPGAVNILLSHNPDVFPVAARKGYHLMLAGHTHGGQVTVEILDQSINPARFYTPYVYGLYRSGAAAGYVTRGIGTIGLPTRIGAPPEISLLRLRKV